MNKAQLAALIERLIESCADEEDMDVCGRCIDELVEAGKAAVPTLVDLLADWDEWVDVRLAAVEALGRIGGRPAIKALETALENDPHTDVQGAAAQALSRLKSDRSIARLLRALDTTDRGKRMATILALAQLRNPAAVPRLEELADQLDAVGDNGVAGTTRAAVVYIREGISGLESIVDDKGQDIELRRGVATVLDEAHHLDALPILIRCIRDDDEELRYNAYQSLIGPIHALKPQGSAIGREIVSVLIEALSSDPSELRRSSAAQFLEVMADPAALPALEKATADPDKYVRRDAAETIAALRKIKKKS